jgi:hypothetical protein
MRVWGPRLLASAITVGLGCVSGSAWAGDPAEEHIKDADPAAVPESGTGTTMFLVGAAITAGWYGAAVGTSYLWTDSPGAHDLRLPVVGPFEALGKTRCADAEHHCNTFTLMLRTLMTTLSAVGQVGGVAVMGEALFLPHSAPRPVASARAGGGDKPGVDSFMVLPLATEDGKVGLSLDIHF